MKFIIVLTEYCFGDPPSGLSSYVTAKYALWGFAKALTVELARFHCTVNCVSPCMVETVLLNDLPPKLLEIETERNPLNRLGKPEDIASTVSFLASEKADFLNGVNIPVNGGSKLV